MANAIPALLPATVPLANAAVISTSSSPSSTPETRRRQARLPPPAPSPPPLLLPALAQAVARQQKPENTRSAESTALDYLAREVALRQWLESVLQRPLEAVEADFLVEHGNASAAVAAVPMTARLALRALESSSGSTHGGGAGGAPATVGGYGRLRGTLSAVLNRQMDAGTLAAALRSGVVLCRFMETIVPRSIAAIHPRHATLNVVFFLEAVVDVGVPRERIFRPADLTEGRCLPAVYETLVLLADACYAKQSALLAQTMVDDDDDVSLLPLLRVPPLRLPDVATLQASEQQLCKATHQLARHRVSRTAGASSTAASSSSSSSSTSATTTLAAQAIAARVLARVSALDPEAIRRLVRAVTRLQAAWRGRSMRQRYLARLRDCTFRARIAHEILSTERRYVESLAVALQVFVEPLKIVAERDSLSERNDQMPDRDQIRAIFGELSVIAGCNRQLLEMLRPRVENWMPYTPLGDIFVQISSFLRIYTQYVNNYDRAVEIRVALEQSKPAFKAFLRQAEALPQLENRDLGAFLIMPVQRIPRYELLLRELLRYTWHEHPDFDNLTLALGKIHDVATYLNAKKERAEGLSKLLEVQARFGGKLDLDAEDGAGAGTTTTTTTDDDKHTSVTAVASTPLPSTVATVTTTTTTTTTGSTIMRRVVRESVADEFASVRLNGRQRSSLRLYLFTDALLLAKMARGRDEKKKAVAFLDAVAVQEDADDARIFTLSLPVRSRRLTLQLECRSVEQRNMWVSLFLRAIATHRIHQMARPFAPPMTGSPAAAAFQAKVETLRAAQCAPVVDLSLSKKAPPAGRSSPESSGSGNKAGIALIGINEAVLGSKRLRSAAAIERHVGRPRAYSSPAPPLPPEILLNATEASPSPSPSPATTTISTTAAEENLLHRHLGASGARTVRLSSSPLRASSGAGSGSRENVATFTGSRARSQSLSEPPPPPPALEAVVSVERDSSNVDAKPKSGKGLFSISKLIRR